MKDGMKGGRKRAWKGPAAAIQDMALIAAAIAAAWAIAGFFHSDPLLFAQNSVLATALAWTLRIGLPLGWGGMVWLAWRMRSGKTSAAGPLVLAAGLILILLVLYPVADVRIQDSRSGRARSDASPHAFLQLAPAPMPDSAGTGFRIFCVGGSTTEFTDSKGGDWPSRLEARLKDEMRRDDIRVFNCGRQWYTSLHALLHYETNLRPLKPDVLVFMEAINDILVNADFAYFSTGPFRPDYGHFAGPVSGLFRRRSLARSGLDYLGRFWYHEPRRAVEQDTFPGLPSYVSNLNTLADLIEKDGAVVVFVTQPNLYSDTLSTAGRKALVMLNREAIGPDRQWAFGTALSAFREYRSALIRVAENRGLPWVDAEAAVPKTLAYFKDDVHYRDPAFDLVAKAVAEGLMQKGAVR